MVVPGKFALVGNKVNLVVLGNRPAAPHKELHMGIEVSGSYVRWKCQRAKLAMTVEIGLNRDPIVTQ